MLENITFEEYLRVINPKNKYFGNSDYKVTVQEMNCDRLLPSIPKEISTFTTRNNEFKILETSSLGNIEHIAINNKKEIISLTDDEFGSLMIKTAVEYQSMGVGSELLYHHLKKNPFRNTGGLTDRGYRLYKSVFRRIVDENLANGVYKNLDSTRLSEILTSTY